LKKAATILIEQQGDWFMVGMMVAAVASKRARPNGDNKKHLK
jgi:hypothetical protein